MSRDEKLLRAFLKRLEQTAALSVPAADLEVAVEETMSGFRC